MCYPDFHDEESSRFFSLLADNLTGWQKNLAEKTTKTTLETVIKAGVSIGISSLFLAVDLVQIGVGIMKLAEVVRNRALSFYLGARGRGDSHEVAWSVAGIPPLYDNWQTQEFFKSLWNKYGKHMSEDGLDKYFEQQEREKLRTSFLHGLGVRAHPVVTAPSKISPPPPYYVGDKIKAEFTITNKGTVPITFNILTVGGRDPDGQVADFPFRRDITLSPNKSYNYKGALTLAKAGNYHFFCAYQTIDGKWNPSVNLGPGLTEEDRTKDITVKVKEAKTKLIKLYFSDSQGEYLVPEERKMLALPQIDQEAKEILKELIKGPLNSSLKKNIMDHLNGRDSVSQIEI